MKNLRSKLSPVVQSSEYRLPVLGRCKGVVVTNRPIPHKLIGWANYFLLKCWGKNHDVMLPFKHCFNGRSVQF